MEESKALMENIDHTLSVELGGAFSMLILGQDGSRVAINELF